MSDMEVLVRQQNWERTYNWRNWPPHGQFDALKSALDLVDGFDVGALADWASAVRGRDNRVFFIGNGGSAAIASHMAADWSKNGRVSALCFNDPAALTCFANDVSFAAVFSHQLMLHARRGDMLFAISSSGQSANIVQAASRASESGIYTVTLSGFEPDNPLRRIGHHNIYVPSSEYGIVEITHLACLHAVLDRLCANGR